MSEDCPSCAQMKQWYGPDGDRNALKARVEVLTAALTDIETLHRQTEYDDCNTCCLDQGDHRTSPSFAAWPCPTVAAARAALAAGATESEAP